MIYALLSDVKVPIICPLLGRPDAAPIVSKPNHNPAPTWDGDSESFGVSDDGGHQPGAARDVLNEPCSRVIPTGTLPSHWGTSRCRPRGVTAPPGHLPFREGYAKGADRSIDDEMAGLDTSLALKSRMRLSQRGRCGHRFKSTAWRC